MNVFIKEEVAANYDSYYKTPVGKEIDRIEKQAIESLLPVASKDTILELGCGTGHWSEFLSSKGFKVCALDISDAMLSKARLKGIKNVEFRKGDAAALSFPDENFNTVVSFTMLEFTKDPGLVIKEIFRVLKPGGLFIAGCLNLNSQLGKTKNTVETFRNAHFFTKTELAELFKEWGYFELNECVYLSPSFEILDGTMETYPSEGVFLGIMVQKN
jgi:ubiquinone/menaquinone biosynthesis C-methylase UbiE